jgi:hypothetical protein
MPERWLTFAPLGSQFFQSGIAFPYYFDDHVSVQSIPEWVWEEDADDLLRGQLRDEIEAGDQHCIAVEYEVDALGSRQLAAANEVFSAYLTLWLAHPTGLSFGAIFHCEHHNTKWVTRQIVPYNQAPALAQYAGNRYVTDDLEVAKRLFIVLRSVSANGPVYMAAQVAKKALVEGSWEIRFLLF